MMIYPLLDLPQLFVSGKQAFVNIDRLEEMKHFPTFNKDESYGKPVTEFTSLAFDQVSFRYPGKEDKVLDELSFELAIPERMLILGATGAGKSTVANLILGLLPTEQGHIRVNGEDIETLQIKSLRDVVAYVPQEPSLFSGSIKDNVMLANDQASEDEYQTAMDTAQ
jgi:ABC-type multidrug transport system fused ATPase/permease subunit